LAGVSTLYQGYPICMVALRRCARAIRRHFYRSTHAYMSSCMSSCRISSSIGPESGISPADGELRIDWHATFLVVIRRWRCDSEIGQGLSRSPASGLAPSGRVFERVRSSSSPSAARFQVAREFVEGGLQIGEWSGRSGGAISPEYTSRIENSTLPFETHGKHECPLAFEEPQRHAARPNHAFRRFQTPLPLRERHGRG